MVIERFNPLNDYIFLKIMGEKGDEEQLLAFLNAVLKRPEKQLQSIEIIESKAFPADIIGGKSCVLDVRAVYEDSNRVNIEVQLRDLGNMERRSLYYWSREFTKGLSAGQEYEETPNVIAINIVDYMFQFDIPDFHTTFHIWEDKYKDIKLTDALEIHFIEMVKFRSLEERDIQNDPLHRWLVYLDKGSPQELIEEAIKMDIGIQKADTKLRIISQDEETRRIYEMREKALSDWTSGVNHARREGKQEGRLEERQKILKMLKSGKSLEEIIKEYGSN